MDFMQKNIGRTRCSIHYIMRQTVADMPKYNRIKAVLADKDKTAKWLAQEIGRDRSTISRWCTNDIQPPLEVLYQIAELLEVDVRELLVPNR